MLRLLDLFTRRASASKFQAQRLSRRVRWG
jgi:hypothetical protein